MKKAELLTLYENALEYLITARSCLDEGNEKDADESYFFMINSFYRFTIKTCLEPSFQKSYLYYIAFVAQLFSQNLTRDNEKWIKNEMKVYTEINKKFPFIKALVYAFSNAVKYLEEARNIENREDIEGEEKVNMIENFHNVIIRIFENMFKVLKNKPKLKLLSFTIELFKLTANRWVEEEFDLRDALSEIQERIKKKVKEV